MYRIALFIFVAACGQSTPYQDPANPVGIALESLPYIDSLSLPSVQWNNYGIQLEKEGQSYDQTLTQVDSTRRALQSEFQAGRITTDSVGKVFTELMVNKIMPYWYGTPWDFEGHTDVPNEGMIACGYLVSTTLKHLGLNLNRYRLAQQAALNEAKTLALDKPIVSMIRMPLTEVIEKIKEQEEGLYIIGLDYHVGLILHQKEEIFFIHSSIYEPVSVVIEPAVTSMALLYNDDYYLAPISNNEKLMTAWLNVTRIEVVKGE